MSRNTPVLALLTLAALAPTIAAAAVPTTYRADLRTLYVNSHRPGEPEAYRLMINDRGNFVVRDDFTGETSKEFNPADIGYVTFTGDADDDMIINDTAIDMMAWGGDGDDVLIGGSGDDTLSGGRGTDSLYGNEGVDALLPGVDIREGTVDGGPGADWITVTKFTGAFGNFRQGFSVPVRPESEDLIFFQTISIP